MDGEFHTTSILIQVVSIVDYLSVAHPYTWIAVFCFSED